MLELVEGPHRPRLRGASKVDDFYPSVSQAIDLVIDVIVDA